MSEDDSRFDLTRRRLLGGIAVTGTAASGVGAGTMAYLSDTESSTGNSVQAGTMDLDLRNGGSGVSFNFAGAAPGGSAESGALKGGFFAQLHNTGSIDADHIEVDFSYTEIEDGDGDLSTEETTSTGGGAPESDPVDGASGMAEYVYVELLRYVEEYDSNGNEVSVIPLVSDGQPAQSSGTNHYIDDTDGNGYVDLADLAADENADALDDFAAPPPGGSPDSTADADNTGFEIEVSLHEDTPNKYQGDVVQTDVSFSLHQDTSQDNP